MNDEGFREIQLNGKQLVFLFMAATVVSVVIFLCGVLVGRGVRGGGGAMVEATSVEVAADPAVSAAPASAAASDGAAAPHAPEELSYAERLLRDTPPEENLKPAPAAPPATPAPVVQEPVAAAAPDPPPRPAAETPAAEPSATPAITASDPSGPGFAIQVAISKDRREADTLVKELIAKGYPAFVMDPAQGAPAGIYRVRVGKYRNRKDAEEIAARLKAVEQFAPWIAR